MTHKVKIFESVFPDFATGHRTTLRDQIWWKSAVAKFVKGRVVYQTKKNSGSAGLVPALILAKMGRSHPKFPERCHPLTCPRIPNFVRIGCVLPDYSGKIDFSTQKVNTMGFQPKITNREIIVNLLTSNPTSRLMNYTADRASCTHAMLSKISTYRLRREFFPGFHVRWDTSFR